MLDLRIRSEEALINWYFSDNTLSWLSDGSWKIKVNCEADSMCGVVLATNRVKKITLEIHDSVYNEKNVLVRKVIVRNESGERKPVKLFFYHEFRLYSAEGGDTAYYDPVHKVIVHYKGKRVFLANCFSGTRNFDDFAVGSFASEGKEGTFRDAEDGMLSRNAIEHGQVDSVMGISLFLEPKGETVSYYTLAVGESVKEVHDIDAEIRSKSPEHVIQTTGNFWRAWLKKYDFHFQGLSQK